MIRWNSLKQSGQKVALASGLVVLGSSSLALGRGIDDCQLAWGQAVRSYLTQNRTKGPEDATWKAACEKEQSGDKEGARIEAISIGAEALAKLDNRGCQGFLKAYVEASSPERICEAAAANKGDEVRKLVKDSAPPAPTKRKK
ncbi:MAG: hypothetical protein HY791_17525 [Deltaproteobacteria bacterium]|nr:hypothetical protein [Deltaproteobacteria bacterium]